MIKNVYETARVVNSGNHLTTVNELTDQIPALRPKVLWKAALEIVKMARLHESRFYVRKIRVGLLELQFH
jgi:adenine phosphoribosyltransferase